MKQHLCLDKAYNSRMAKQEIIKRGYVPHMPYKRKRGGATKEPKRQHEKETLQEDGLWREPTHDDTTCSGKPFARYEKKTENYLGLVQTAMQYHNPQKNNFGIGS